jgi:tripartite ATP-independent transporter DctP family solute receptor
MEASMKKALYVLLMVLLVCGIAFAAGGKEPAAKQETFTIKLGHSNQPTMDSIFHQVSLKLKELVEKDSQGRIKVEIYPASQLGSEEQQVQSTQLGTQQVVVVGMNNLNPSIPQLGYFTLPYIFESTKEGRKVIDAMWDQNNKWAVEGAGLRFLAVMDAGFRELTNSKKPVKNLKDLQDLRVRVPQNPIQVGVYKAWGVNPIVVSWSETFNALQQKVVDAQDNPWTVFVSEKFYEIQKYVTEISYIFQTSAIVISEPFFQKLPQDLQAVVVKAGKETMAFERNLSDTGIEKDKAFLKEKGMILLGPPEDKKDWVEKGRSIWPQFHEMIGKGDKQRGIEILKIVESHK